VSATLALEEPDVGRGLARTEEDRYLRAAFRTNARTFALSALLLPPRTRLPVATLYLYCRTVDEIADRRPPRAGAAEELDAVGAAVADTFAGHTPQDTANELLWRRLAEVRRDFPITDGPLLELIDGARWDVEGRPIRHMKDLLDYSELVAGSVGAMMLPLLVEDSSLRGELEAPARALGRAMQITNILRDVGEDRSRLGRVCLPADMLSRHALAPSDLDRVPADRAAYSTLCEELMELAEGLYDQAAPGIDKLPWPQRGAVRAAARMYREILNEVRAAGYDNISRRAVVPLRRKLRAAAGGYQARRSAHLAGGPART
jgi:phytoene synthase